MSFRASEDRLNPVPPPDADETTLGGYAAVYGRSAALEGLDGSPYTISLEAEEEDGRWAGYLVFLRWADTGSAVMGHMETGDLVTGDAEAEVREALEAMSLQEVKALLDRTIESRRSAERDDTPPTSC